MANSTVTETRTCRLLYYGPAGAGKRENLRLINRSLPPKQRLALATVDPERQIAFRLNTESDGQWQVLVQAIDAGKEKLPSAGLDANPPFDGIIFVVSSRASLLDHSLAALESLKSYLEAWNLDLVSVPVVLQYNGGDAEDTLPVDRLESLLNPWGLLSFPASTSADEGVRETLKSILGLTVNHLQKSNPQGTPAQGPSSSPSFPKANESQSLVLEYGPPLPGMEMETSARQRGEAIFNEMSPPVVIPVIIPRRLLAGPGPVRLILEVEISD